MMNQRLMHLERLLLLLVLLLAFGLRMAYLDASSLWSDEGNTWALIQRSYNQIAVDTAADIHPPGYYWLLKGWATWAGFGAFEMRFFSVWFGLVLVTLIYPIGRILSNRDSVPLTYVDLPPFLAMIVAAVNPFLIFYSQEARMYMLLSLAGVLLFFGVFNVISSEQPKRQLGKSRHGLLFILVAGVVGLWTHYSFPILLLAAGLTYLIFWLRMRRIVDVCVNGFLFLVTFLIIGLSYLPWLGVAIRQVMAWPQLGTEFSWSQGVALTGQTLLFGPLRNIKDPAWTWLALAAILPLIGTIGLRPWKLRQPESILACGVLFWTAAPIGMMFGLNLFGDSFLKFLVTASPGWCLLVAAAPLLSSLGKANGDENDGVDSVKWSGPEIVTVGMSMTVLLFAFAAAYIALPGYYTTSTVRDNYAGMAEYIQYAQAATARAADSDYSSNAVVILNAPGQQDVWKYYDPGLPVLALPKERPANREETIGTLSSLGSISSAYTLFWATSQSDPEGIVERWLNQHGFKGLDIWQGNVRFVTYTFADQLTCQPHEPPLHFGDVPQSEQIRLAQTCRSPRDQIVSGEVTLTALYWQALQPIDERLKVTLQLLDSRNHVIAQRDSEPGGGTLPTSEWEPITDIQATAITSATDNFIVDQHGLLIPPGTPPGDYRLVVALYDSVSGQRYFVGDADFALLGSVRVTRPQEPPPLSLLPMTYRIMKHFDSVTLLGHDIYAKGFSHDHEQTVKVDELVHVTLYWQAAVDANSALPADMQMTLSLGAESVVGPLAGGGHPTAKWQLGDIVRGEFDIPFDGTDRHLYLQVEDDRLYLGSIP